ncbi:MAG: hypothetical protein VX527_11835 [Planctomycetota bacterium]|nr:hypothetical protein [Planctomycetota bacterium]
MTASPPRRVILCPLQIEANALRKAGIADPLKVCGPGADAVEKAVLEIVQTGEPPMLILAGLAGGLDPRIKAGEARWVTRIVSPTGALLGQVSQPRSKQKADCTVCTVDSPVDTPQAKQELHKASGADLVDMESSRFVEVCQQLGVSWAILRGVSDDSAQHLPGGSEHMVDHQGCPRLGQICKFLLSHPWHIPSLIKLSLRTSRALKRVAAELNS